jgi:LPXTG-site transpeptidase (sortase) family protein
MATPGSFATVGWYKLGSRPGQAGNAVLAGHVNNALTKSGVFEHLSDLKVGDSIAIADTSGKTLTYVVTETDQYKTTEAPAASIFSGAGPTQLVLITCDGAWDAAAHSYDKRFVVYARLVK